MNKFNNQSNNNNNNNNNAGKFTSPSLTTSRGQAVRAQRRCICILNLEWHCRCTSCVVCNSQ